jgi:DNA-binding winged helix-turn-helix (wHTH) protein/tetratricopeptide (TPR) repeat protein
VKNTPLAAQPDARPAAPGPGVYEIGEFVLDPARRTLTRADGTPVTISAKAFDALVVLAARAGEVVSRAALAKELWPTTIVEDNNLSQTILALRRALGDDGDEARYVVTIPRRGYQLAAPVKRAAARVGTHKHRSRRYALALTVAVAVAVGAAWYGASRDQSTPVVHSGAEIRPDAVTPAAYAAFLRATSDYRVTGAIGVSMPTQARAETLGYLDEALALYPRYGPALAWRANIKADSLMFDLWRDADTAVTIPQLMASIEADARRAVELDPMAGIGYAALARLYLYRWRFADARTTLDRALAVNPDDSVLLHYSAMTSLLLDEPERAVTDARRALALDPNNPAPHAPLAMALRALGNVKEAADTSRAMINRAPTAAIGYIGLARTLTSSDDRGEVLETIRLGEQFLGDLRSFRLDAALSYAHAGAREDAARLVADFERSAEGYRVDPGLAAMAALALRDYPRAAAALHTAIAIRSTGMDPLPLDQIRRNTWSDPVLEGPEWRELRAQLAYDP